MGVIVDDSSVARAIMYQDVATAIDGGRDGDGVSTPESRAASLLACGPYGGVVPIVANLSQPYYHDEWFIKNNLSAEGTHLFIQLSTTTKIVYG